ncbi:MAG: EsaB/YukD family protein [Chloroflexota bacterium]|nr:EsaB/YukD family protein [Chloroflexota bacterium]
MAGTITVSVKDPNDSSQQRRVQFEADRRIPSKYLIPYLVSALGAPGGASEYKMHHITSNKVLDLNESLSEAQVRDGDEIRLLHRKGVYGEPSAVFQQEPSIHDGQVAHPAHSAGPAQTPSAMPDHPDAATNPSKDLKAMKKLSSGWVPIKQLIVQNDDVTYLPDGTAIVPWHHLENLWRTAFRRTFWDLVAGVCSGGILGVVVNLSTNESIIIPDRALLAITICVIGLIVSGPLSLYYRFQGLKQWRRLGANNIE